MCFSRIENKNGHPIFHFRKTDYNAVYSPQDSEQPLRYLLRFLLKCYYDERSKGFWVPLLRRLFDTDKYLKEAVNIFAKDCKVTDGFEIISGSDLLELN